MSIASADSAVKRAWDRVEGLAESLARAQDKVQEIERLLQFAQEDLEQAEISAYEMDDDEFAIWKAATGGEMSMGQAIRWAVRHRRDGFAALLRAS